MRWVLYAVMGMVLAAGLPGSAQTFDLNALRQPVSELKGQWRFHPGDDARWADPAFDDTDWALLNTGSHWPSQGYPGVTIGWYRLHLLVPEGQPLAVFVPGFRASYEAFADGVRIGGAGDVGPNVSNATMTARLIQLPAPRPGSREIVLAFRTAVSPAVSRSTAVNPVPPLLVGDAAQVAERARFFRAAISWSEMSAIVMVTAWILAALGGFALFALRPLEREYLWFGLMAIALAVFNAWSLFMADHTVQRTVGNSLNGISGGLFTMATVGFFARLLDVPRNRTLALIFGCSAFILLASAVNLFWPLSATALNVIIAIGLAPTILWLMVVLSRAAFRGVADARLMLVPVGMLWGLFIVNLVTDIVYQMRGETGPDLLDRALTHWPFDISGSDLSMALFLLGTLAILLNRFSRSRREEERYASEMEAARAVQQVLLPEPNAELEGFAVVAEYHPAQEVGGDFYQVLRATDGGLFVVTGDVSGKGLPAAMLVAMLVGAVRAEAAHTNDPAVLLEAVNSRVHGRMSGGFATCLAVHLNRRGEVTLANAANPAPYVNGEELSVPGALPIGVADGVSYENVQLTLRPGELLTLVSDGIVEAARGDTSELYGFERTCAASRKPAAEQVEMARSFGQNDDMTVLTITRLAEVSL